MSEAKDPALPRNWPQVPACYDWLSLDSRGQWRLQGEAVLHPGLVAYLGSRYGMEENGCWLVRNGPQRVYVELEAAPWILRLHADQRFINHRGDEASLQGSFALDADGRLFVATDLGPAMLDDRDLAEFFGEVCTADGKRADDETLLAFLAAAAAMELSWHGRPLQALGSAGDAAARHFGFIRRPQSAAG